jgi:DNA transformation protein
MAVSRQYLDYLVGQLEGVGRLSVRRMFGGVGFYSGGIFFGLVYKERLYFKTDDATRPEYEARGSEGFRPRANLKGMKMTYYTVPAEVLEDEDELVKWARKGVAAALAKEPVKEVAKERRKTPGKRLARKSREGLGKSLAKKSRQAPGKPPAKKPRETLGKSPTRKSR